MTRFPAEWEKQSAVLIAWPHETGDFSNRLAAVEQSYAFIAKTISHYQTLIIVCRDPAHEQQIRRLLADTANIHFVHAQTNDIWVRDTVFLTVEQDGTMNLLNFIFNGWGEKYPHTLDNALNHALLEKGLFQDVPHRDINFVLEGGSIESDGNGAIMTTRQCLLNPNRNPGSNQAIIERQLRHFFGAERVLWLDQKNLSGDDTDAHIDTLARFCTADTIAYTSCDDETDPHYAGLKNMEAQLRDLRTASDAAYQLIPLPMPQPIFDEDDQQLPANYANFLIINGAVMVPVYDDPNDIIALQRLAECFPDRQIIATPCRPLVHQYGSLHCMTMQFPVIRPIIHD
ncbi:MAG: agmatine deiminase family protein [Methylovulum sp.]|uniref:agmatine deiminase family protein n=1 Tax=Methylovulum sp. TaxID=1916980 RepID=UPI00261863C6|nr:agmatine deiminase family protein [Methylovulum sp.]MDD2723090.1 agmatine deiminase family protein [Methylovulum sp.]MDD5123556.1 agmatine deiminase family protein [Methylovulum sp.]